MGLGLGRVTADNFDNLRVAVTTGFGSWAGAYTAMAVVTKIATANLGCMVGFSGRRDDAV